MLSVKGLLILISVNLIFFNAFASKCLRAQDLKELKEDFPIVLRGKVTMRTKTANDEYDLKVHVEKLLQGKFIPTEIKVIEIHLGKDFWHVYEVGKIYTFAIAMDGKKGEYKVTLPMDGCPELPSE